MKTLIPYLFFGGRTEAALEHYTAVFRGRVRDLKRLSDVNPGGAAANGKHIIHAEFEADGFVFFASDGMPGSQPPVPNGPVSLALDLDGLAEQDRIWALLAEGGKVEAPLHETFYGARMGALTDRFGVSWMLSCDLQKK